MAINISTQYKYTGKGPVDAKQLVKTYNDLINKNTWTVNSNNIAYNGMIVAVWLDKDDATKNGIYYLYDPECTSTLKNPDVTNSNNWHQLSGNTNLSEDDLQDAINKLIKELDESYADSDNAFAALLTNTSNNTAAIAALVADDADTSVRDIIQDELAPTFEAIDGSIGAISEIATNANNALNALLGDDQTAEGSLRSYLEPIVHNEFDTKKTDRLTASDDALAALVSIAIDNEEAIAALQAEGSITEEQINDWIGDAIDNLTADSIIAGTADDEIMIDPNNNKKLIINHLDITKLTQDPNLGIKIILNGGSAKTTAFN